MLGAIFAYLMLIRWWRKQTAMYRIEWKIKFSDLDFSVSDHSLFQEVAIYKDEKVVVNRLRKKSVCEDRRLVKEMATMKSLKHANTAIFIGACVEVGNICTLWDHSAQGTLDDVIGHTKMRLESTSLSLASDICLGLLYLHTTKDLGYHGRLKSSNCLVDANWVIKLSDFGIARLRKGEDQGGDEESETFCKGLLWTAPERLRCILAKKPQKLTKESDIYSLGMVLSEIFCGHSAYTEEQGTPRDIVGKLVTPEKGKALMRPDTVDIENRHRAAIASNLGQLIKSCWRENPVDRPQAKEVHRQIKRFWPERKRKGFNNVRFSTGDYTTQLQQIFTEGAQHSVGKQEDSFCHNMTIPRHIRRDLKRAKVYNNVTVGFYSFVDFNFVVCQSSPIQVVEILDQLQRHFESIVKSLGACTLETVGDAFMFTTGGPIAKDDHATTAIEAALALQQSVDNVVIEHLPSESLHLRIGLHSGPVVACLLGKKRPKLCMFGQTVDVASRIESQGSPRMVHISHTTFLLMKGQTQFSMEQNERIEVKRGEFIHTYWLRKKKREDPFNFISESADSSQVNDSL